MCLLPRITDLETYHRVYQESICHPELFWDGIAKTFTWKKHYSKILNWSFKNPSITWFEDGTLNITENCIDRHLPERADQPALLFEPNEPFSSPRKYTYRELHQAVQNMAQVLLNMGVTKGDRICLYMGMVPELAISVLACARIGAVHSVIFGGFSAQSVADRINDAQAKFVITQDAAYRGSKCIPLKSILDEALTTCRQVKHVLVLRHCNHAVNFEQPRDIWMDEALQQAGFCEVAAVEMFAEDPLFILYTSGSTGKPKGVVHTTAGYMIWAQYTFEQVFQYRQHELHFCTADLGWITGHSYVLYGPLLSGGTTLMFEGIPTYPDAGRFWDIIDKYEVNIFYTAPTAIRSLMAQGLEPLKNKNLNSLRVIGTVGEPINEEAWQWYKQHIGKFKCPLVDTWWQTETGGILISNLAGVTPEQPSWATLPLPGVQPLLVDEMGRELHEPNTPEGWVKGHLCMRAPWPGIMRSTYGDHERFKQHYFSQYPGLYFTGDGAFRDKLGRYRITGRVDDVLNVSGHRLGTAELENAINRHPAVIESAVVGYPHEIKGSGICAFVICNNSELPRPQIQLEINQTLQTHIGSIAKADRIYLVSGLPKTRSGKIMRRILRKIVHSETETLGDVSTLLDPGVVPHILEVIRNSD